jgi:hypothetical protein
MLNPDQEKKLKYVAKGLKGVKAISNALGTKPTATPDVDTKTSSGTYDGDGSTGNNQSESDYKIDENGVGSLVNKAATPKFNDKNRRKAY